MKNLYLVFCLSLALSSCFKEDSNDVNQDRVYASYNVFYNENDSTTTVSAQFRLGGPDGNPIELEIANNGGAYVSFNNDTLEYDYWRSAHIKEYSGRVSSGSFLYVNNDGDSFTNNLPFLDTVYYPSGFDTLYTNTSDTFQWGGPPINLGHSVELEIDSWFWGSDASFTADTMNQQYIIMYSSELSDLQDGDGKAKLYRSAKSTVVQGTSEGGEIIHRIRVRDKDVEIID